MKAVKVLTLLSNLVLIIITPNPYILEYRGDNQRTYIGVIISGRKRRYL